MNILALPEGEMIKKYSENKMGEMTQKSCPQEPEGKKC